MSFLRRLFGQVADPDFEAVTSAALESLPDRPGDALANLEALGMSVPGGASDRQAWLDAVGLRLSVAIAGENWVVASRDLGLIGPLASERPRARVLLPMVAVLAADPPISTQIYHWLSASDVGCVRTECSHSDGVHAGITILSLATDAPRHEIARAIPPGSEDLWIAAVRCVKANEGAEAALEFARNASDAVASSRVRRVFSTLLLETGAFDEAVRTSDPDEMLSAYAAVGAIGLATNPPKALAAIVQRFAATNVSAPIVAMAAEIDGRYADASAAWSSAGFIDEARQTQFLADPAGAMPDDRILSDDDRWLLYALRRGLRPATAPRRAASVANAAVGDRRRQVEAIRGGMATPSPDFKAPDSSLASVLAVLAGVRDAPAEVETALTRLAQVGPPAELVRALAEEIQPGRERGPDRLPEWKQYLAALGESSSAIPMPVSIDAVIAGASDGALLTVRDLEGLSPDRAAIAAAAAVLNGPRPDLTPWLSTATSGQSLLAILTASSDDAVAMLATLAGCAWLDPDVRRRSGMAAGAVLATVAFRDPRDGTDIAARRVEAALSDLERSPDALLPQEAYRVEKAALAGLRGPVEGAWGPVLTQIAKVPPIPSMLRSHPDLYGPLAHPWMLLAAHRPDDAQEWLRRHWTGPVSSELTDRLVVIAVERALSSAMLIDAAELVLTIQDQDLGEDLAARIARAIDRADIEPDVAVDTLDDLAGAYPDVAMIGVSLASVLYERARSSIDTEIDAAIQDLARVVELDPEHPRGKRSLAYTLVNRASAVFERWPERAVRDVDRATDLFMGDAQYVQMAASIACMAGVVLANRRDLSAARTAWHLARAIDPSSEAALSNLIQTGGI